VQLDFQATTVGAVDRLIFKVNDHYQTVKEPLSGLPIEISVVTHHGKKENRSHYLLDQKNHEIKLDTGKIVKIPPRTFDIPSLFDHLRSLEWKKGKVERIFFLERGNIYELEARLEGQESVEIQGKQLAASRISLRLMDGDQADDTYQIRFFLEEQPAHRPLLITATPKWGQVRVELQMNADP